MDTMIVKLMALCVIGAVLALLLREQKQILAYFVIVGLVLAALPPLLRSAAEIFSFFQVLMDLSALPDNIFSPMLKTVGIAAVTKIGTSLCKEAESDTAAALVEMGGTCCAFLVALPLMQMVLELLEQIL